MFMVILMVNRIQQCLECWEVLSYYDHRANSKDGLSCTAAGECSKTVCCTRTYRIARITWFDGSAKGRLEVRLMSG